MLAYRSTAAPPIPVLHRPIHTVATALVAACTVTLALPAQANDSRPTLTELRALGAKRSRYLDSAAAEPHARASADVERFRNEIEPILRATCHQCHGPDEDEAGLRIDTLDPDLFAGEDVDWWLEILAAVSNGEMPPPDEVEMAGADRAALVDWLSSESQAASEAHRATAEHTPFRRLARYEYEYALQDLLGLPFAFGDDLPPDPVGEDGFENSSETLHLTGSQLRTYLDGARRALDLATVRGERPETLTWDLPMERAAAREWAHQDQQIEALREKHKDDPETLADELEKAQKRHTQPHRGTHFRDRSTGRTASQRWNYNAARFAWKPTTASAAAPEPGDAVAVVPAGHHLIVELGDRVPLRGNLRVRVLASKSAETDSTHALELIFGWQASNDSQANVRLDAPERVVTTGPNDPRIYEWLVPLSQVYPRNSVRGVNKLGDLPNPSEFLKIRNSALASGPVLIDWVQVAAPVYDEWPPASHQRIFFERETDVDERAYIARVIERFVERAWRRPLSADELERKLASLDSVRPRCDTAEDAVLEVLATALASPQFLYVASTSRDRAGAAEGDAASPLIDQDLATRLALFLWCSTPDAELRALAAEGRLADADVLDRQVTRMLASTKVRRFAEQFTRQWLNLQLLDFLHVDKKAHPRFDPRLKGDMREEPVAFFEDLLRRDRSVLEFAHADFAVLNERLARHYGIPGVEGNHFRRVPLDGSSQRGGLLTQAGLLAMNSDGIDSHPLKRGIWMLERLLDDPPPPPPAAVPEIDLTDPRIAQMTLKERIEDHRNHAACMSCHAKIDPWGVAFENYDAVGSWRSEIDGKPVDAASRLFNGEVLDGMDGLKRHLLAHRQDQLVRALVTKLATFALGRPLGFGDRAAVDEITAEVRRRGDGLATMLRAIATSELFRHR